MKSKLLLNILFSVTCIAGLCQCSPFSNQNSSTLSNLTPVSGAWIAEGGQLLQKEVGENISINSTTLFSDHFNQPDGQDQQWSVVHGGLSVSSNELVTASQGETLGIPSPETVKSLTDFKLEVKVKEDQAGDSNDYAIIYFRLNMASASADNSYALRIPNSGSMDLSIRANGKFSTELASAVIVQGSNYHNVIIIATGSTIKIWFDKTEDMLPDISVIDQTYPGGTVGLGSNSINCKFDDLSIENLLTVSASPVHLYPDSSSVVTLSSSINLDHLQLALTSPLNTTWSLANIPGCAGSRSCKIVFPTSFAGANINSVGTYKITAKNDGDTTAILLEVHEKPIISFIQITDTHVLATGTALNELGYFVEDTNAQKYFPLPDFVMVTGDIGDHGTKAELTAAKNKLDALSIPYYVTIGNHDTASETGNDAGHNYADVFGPDKFTYSWTSHQFLFLAMDVTSPYGGYGATLSSPEHLKWLQNILDNNPDRYVFLFTHFGLSPVRDDGNAALLWAGAKVSAPVRTVLESHNKTVINYAGHSHLNGLAITNGNFYIQSPGFVNDDEYRYIEVYPDRVETYLLKKRGYHYSAPYSGEYYPGSVDSTHTASTYTFGLPIERQFVINLPSHTMDFLSGISVAGDSSWKDYAIQANLNMGKEDHIGENVAGIIFRYTDVNNYYAALLDSSTGTIKIQKVQNGAVTVMATTAADIKTDTTYQLKVTAQGNQFVAFLNGARVIDATDSTFSSGKWGFKAYLAPIVFSNVIVSH